MKREQLMVAEFMYAAQQSVRFTPASKEEQVMKVKGHEIWYQPQIIRNQARCDTYIRKIVKGIARFVCFTDHTLLTESIEHIITTVCEFSLYLGIPLSQVFDEIHDSNMTKFTDGFRSEDGKWMKGPSYRRPNLDPIIFI
jgi:hypothetical protein